MPLSDADIGLVPSKPRLSDEDIGLASPGPIQRLNQTWQRLTTDTTTEPSMMTKMGAAMYPMVEPLTYHGMLSQPQRLLGLPDPDTTTSPLKNMFEATPEEAGVKKFPSIADKLSPETATKVYNVLSRVAAPYSYVPSAGAVRGVLDATRKGLENLTSPENIAMIPAFAESLPLRAIIALQALYNAGKTVQEAPARLGELSVTGTPREMGREIAGDVGEVAMPFAIGKTLEKPVPSTGTLPEDYSINRLADIPIRTPERRTETGRPVRGPQVGEPVGLLGQGQGFEVGPGGEARRVGPSQELGELIRQRWDPSIPVLGGTESFTDPKTGLTIEKLKPGASEKEIQSKMAAKLQEEKRYAGAPIDPDELRPAIRLMSGQLLRGQKGQVHDDIIRDHNLKAIDVDRRGFVGPTGWVDREEGPDSGYPVPGLHANDLAQIQERQVIPNERQEKGSQEGQQELLDPNKTLAASEFAKMQEAASGDKRRQAEAARRIKEQDYGDVGQRLYSGVPLDVEKAWDTIKSIGKYTSNRKAVPQLLDAADSAAKIGGRQKGNAFRYTVPDETDRKAITFISETLDNRKGLDTFASMVKGNKEATAAIERAKSGWDRLYPKAVELSKHIENQRQVELANNVETPFLENYIKHTFEDDELGFMQTGSGGAGVSTAFLKDRTFPNYATAIQEGYKPKTLDAAKLLESRVAAGLKLVNRYRWAESMKGLKTTDGDPLVAPLTRKAGKIVTPDGYQQVEIMPGVNVNVADDYAPLFKALMGESVIRGNALGDAVLKIEHRIKTGLLLFDTYHAFRVLRKELFLTGKISYNKSLSLLEHDAKTIDLMEKNGDISKEHADWIRANRADAQLAIKTGLNVGRLSEVLYNDVMRKELKVLGVDVNIPGRFSKWVFDKVSRGTMLQSWLVEFNRKMRADPTRARNDVAMETSREMNIYYGNLMRQGVLKSATARDAAQIFLLAPQWFESMVRTEAGAAKQLATAPTDLVRGKPIGGLGKAVGTGIIAYFVANQLINNLTKGHSTWNNEEEGHKLDAWLPSITGKGGFWLSPFSDVAEVTHDYIRYGAKGLNPLESTARILSNKASPLFRAEETLRQGTDFSGTKLKGMRRLEEAGVALLPTPLPMKGIRGEVPGQTERQAYSSVGLKVEPETSEERRQAETKGMSLRDRVLYDKKQKTEMQQRELKQPLEKREEASLRAGQLARESNVKRGQEVYNKLTKADQMWIASRRLTVPELEDELSLKGQKIRLTKPESEKLIRYTQEEYSELAMPILRANYDRLPVQEAKDKLFSQVMTAARQRARVRLEREMLGSKNELDKKPKRFSAFDFLR